MKRFSADLHSLPAGRETGKENEAQQDTERQTMSYLNPLRLHFCGSFQAAVSTVNDDPAHFNNATFQPQYQQRQEGQNANGWWNPRGDANWRMIGCNISFRVARRWAARAGRRPRADVSGC